MSIGYENMTERIAFKSIDEVHEYRKNRMFPSMLLEDGERKIIIMPGFDLRETDDRTYGQSSADLVFAERRGDKVLSAEFFTGWDVHPNVNKGYEGFMGRGYYYHSRYKKDAINPEYASKSSDCSFTGHQCYGEAGSALHGDTLAAILVNRGSEGLWAEFEKEWKEWNDGK